jgi:hypothetical protein
VIFLIENDEEINSQEQQESQIVNTNMKRCRKLTYVGKEYQEQRSKSKKKKTITSDSFLSQNMIDNE